MSDERAPVPAPRRYAEHFPTLSIDGDRATIGHDDFKGLPTYSTSVPTGVDAGKVWKVDELHRDRIFDDAGATPREQQVNRMLAARARQAHLHGYSEHWLLGAYEAIPGDDDHVNIVYRKLTVNPQQEETGA